jgi:hypothetical protein
MELLMVLKTNPSFQSGKKTVSQNKSTKSYAVTFETFDSIAQARGYHFVYYYYP